MTVMVGVGWNYMDGYIQTRILVSHEEQICGAAQSLKYSIFGFFDFEFKCVMCHDHTIPSGLVFSKAKKKVAFHAKFEPKGD